MSTKGIPQGNLVSGKQTLSCAFIAWIGPIHLYLILLPPYASLLLVVPMILGHGYNHGATDAAAFIMVFKLDGLLNLCRISNHGYSYMLRSPKTSIYPKSSSLLSFMW